MFYFSIFVFLLMTSSLLHRTALATTDWVAANLASGSIRVVDGTWFAPHQFHGTGRSVYDTVRVPTATFFDIDSIAVNNTTTNLPHMLPKPGAFASMVGALGISDTDTIVVYDSERMVAAPRVWYSLRVYGARDVSIMSGGLQEWRSKKFPVDTTTPPPPPPPRTFSTEHHRPEMIATLDDIVRNLDTREAVVLDARGPGRFLGVEPEPRPGVRGGHVPGAVNVPFSSLVDEFTGVMKSAEHLRGVFARAGVRLDPDTKYVTMCGSGVTAAFINLALHMCGHPQSHHALYDGSWTEYGLSGHPIATDS